MGITKVSETCVGDEAVVTVLVENTSSDTDLTEAYCIVQIADADGGYLHEKEFGPVTIEKSGSWEVVAYTGWTPDEAGTYRARAAANARNNTNGFQLDEEFFEVCSTAQCPPSPTVSSNVIYLGSGSTGSVTYISNPASCCYEVKLTISSGRFMVTDHSPDSWVTVGASQQVSVTVDRTQLDRGTVVGRVDWRSCDRKSRGAHYILVRDGEEADAAQSTEQPTGVTGDQLNHSGTEADPVLTANLELVFPAPEPDFSTLFTPAAELQRTYLSNLAANKEQEFDFGPGWTSNYDWYIVPSEYEAYVFGPAGFTARFFKPDDEWILDWPKEFPSSLIEVDQNKFIFFDGHEEQFLTFSEFGFLDAIEEQDGSTQTIERVGPFVSKIEFAGGSSWSFMRDAFGRITEITDGTSTSRYTYQDGMLSSVTNRLGQTTTYEYQTGTGLLRAEVSPEGRSSVTTDYAPDGSVKSQDFGEGQVYTFERTDDKTSITGPDGDIVVHTHDDAGRLTGITNPSGASSSFDYNADGNRTTVRDFTGGTTTRVHEAGLLTGLEWADESSLSATYVDVNRNGMKVPMLSKVEAKDGPSIAMSRTDDGEVIAVLGTRRREAEYANRRPIITEGLEGQIRNAYSSSGLLNRRVFRDGSTETHAYDEDELTKTITRSAGPTELWTFDQAHRVSSYQNGAGVWEFTRDRDGYLISTEDPVGRMSRATYDSYGRITNMEYVGNPGLEWNLTWEGARLTSFDRVAFTYDWNNRLASVRKPAGWNMGFSYNDENRLNGFSLNGNQYEVGSDAMGRYTTVEPVFGRGYEFQWGNLGMPKSVRAGGVTTYYSFNPDLTEGSSWLSDNARVSFRVTYDGTDTYQLDVTDGNGHPWSMKYDGSKGTRTFTNPVGDSVTETYSVYGELQSIDWGEGVKADFQWTNGKMTKITADNDVYTAEYDASGLLSNVNGDTVKRDDVGRIVSANGTAAIYDEDGNVSAFVVIGSGRKTEYSYDNGNLKTITDSEGRTSEIEYDQHGRVRNIILPQGGTTTFEYFPDGYVEKITYPDGSTVEHERDHNGNIIGTMWSENVDLGSAPADKSITYNERNHIVNADYDQWGNLELGDMYGTTLSYNYNGVNGLNGEDNITLDPYGHLDSYTDTTGTWTFTYSPIRGNPVLLECTTTGGTTWSFVTMPDGHLLYAFSEDDIRYFLDDGQGNVIAQMDSSGEYTSRAMYTPFGEPIGSIDSDLPLGFKGAYGSFTLEGLVFYEGGSTIMAPALAVETNANNAMPCFPIATNPLFENVQATTTDGTGDKIVEAIDQYFRDQFGVGIIVGPKEDINDVYTPPKNEPLQVPPDADESVVTPETDTGLRIFDAHNAEKERRKRIRAAKKEERRKERERKAAEELFRSNLGGLADLSDFLVGVDQIETIKDATGADIHPYNYLTIKPVEEIISDILLPGSFRPKAPAPLTNTPNEK